MTSVALENLLTRDGSAERWQSRDESAWFGQNLESLADQLRLQTLSIGTSVSAQARATIETRIGELRRARVTDLAMRVGQRLPRYAMGVSPLNQLLARGPVVVAFYMGEWSPYCGLAYRAMDAWKDEFERFDARVLSVFPSGANVEDDAVYVDKGDRLATRFGIRTRFSRDVAAVFDGLGFDVPSVALQNDVVLSLPATFVIDRQRVIRYAFVDPDFRKRAEPSDIADALSWL